MDARELELVVALGEERHVTRAAARIGLSQPAFTQALARLERRLDTRLFERSSRAVSPTAAGAALIPRARLLLSELEEAERLVRRVARGDEGTVRIGAVGSALVGIAPQIVRTLRTQHPELVVDLIEALGTEQVDRLRRGLLDLGIIHVDADTPPTGLRALRLREEPLTVVVPDGHRLGSRTTVRLSELAGESLVVLRREDQADTQHIYLDACRAAGVEPAHLVEVTSLQGLLGQVSAGAGWGFVVESVSRAWVRPDLHFLTIRGTTPTLPTAIVWSPDHLSPAADTVIALTAVANVRRPSRGGSS